MIENIAPKFSKKPIKVVGCGLAGAEIAFILANNGFDVHVFENGSNQKTEKFDYYDKYETCLIDNMIYELECLNSPIVSIAKKMDFKNFGFEYDSSFFEVLKSKLLSHPKIKYFDCTIDTLSDTETTVLATGHHTDKKLLTDLQRYIKSMQICYFQPEKMVIDADSVNLSRFNFANSTECYLNLSQNEYESLHAKLMEIDAHYELPETLLDEKQITAESIARRGKNGLRNAIFRPRFDAKQEEKPYASLKFAYNKKMNALLLEDFFSALEEKEQKSVLDCINLLKDCQICRYSKIKRKTYILAPACLNENLQIKGHENIFVCGGFVGTGGSFESLLMANYCAYKVISSFKGNGGVDLLKENTCIAILLDNLLRKSVVNFRLINLSYDIIDKEDLDMKNFERLKEVQKFLSKSQIEKFKEKFYGKYF